MNVNVFGPGTGRVLLSDVRCTINDTTISSCGHNGVAIAKCGCDHDKDAGVICNSMFVNF